MAGDVELFDQQKKPSATLVASADGSFPSRGDAVEIVGEGANGPQVGALTAAGNFVGILTEVPVDLDEDATFADGEVVGEVTLEVPYAAHWFPEGATPPAAGDSVVVDTGGARAYDTTGGDTADLVTGTCWRTVQFDEGTTNKVAVLRQKR